MRSALQFRSKQFDLIEEYTYATADDFQRLFAREMIDLFRLSLCLTVDAEKAERGLILAMRECFANNSVSREWALIWARRAVVRNAIRLVFGAESLNPHNTHCEAALDSRLPPSGYQIEALQDSLAILMLPDLERLVFVICELERYSIPDCALLLKRSPKEISDARVRAINQVAAADASPVNQNRHRN